MGAIAAGVVGAALIGGGAAMGANSASKSKKALRRIAETPGVDLNATTDEAGSLAEGTNKLEHNRNQFNADELNTMLERSIPGYGQGQKQRTDNANSLLRGEIPMDVSQELYRRNAGRALSGGYGGSGAAHNLNARDLGLTSLDLQGRGASEFAGIVANTPRAALAQYDWSPEEIQRIRSEERARRMQMSAQAEGAPGASQVYSKSLQSVGGQLLGGALMSSGGGN